MPFNNDIKDYTDLICKQIRFKNAHERIASEMTAHVEDQRDAYLEQGMSPSDATKMAISDTGDAMELGTYLDRVHRPAPNWGLLTLTAILLILGCFIRVILMGTFISGSPLGEILTLSFGILIMFLMYFTDFTLIGKYGKHLYIVTTLMGILLVFMSPKVNGRAFFPYLFNFPLSYLGLIFPITYAALIFNLRQRGLVGLLMGSAAFIIQAIILLAVPSMTAFVLYSLSAFITLGIAITKNWFVPDRFMAGLVALIAFIPFIVLFGVRIISLTPYAVDRIKALFFPSQFSENLAYTATVTRRLLDSSIFVGMGTMPNSLEGFSFPLPNVSSDFLLTFLTFNCGWLFTILIVAITCVFMVIAFRYSLRQTSSLGLLISISATTALSFQFISFIIYNLGVQIFSPLSLPLVSQSGAALVFNMMLIGLMLSVFRTGHVACEDSFKLNPSRLIRYENGILSIQFKR